MSYNGWTNYETWRVNLEVFSDYDLDDFGPLDQDMAREMAENIYFEGVNNIWATGLIHSFLNCVDWREISNHYGDTGVDE